MRGPERVQLLECCAPAGRSDFAVDLILLSIGDFLVCTRSMMRDCNVAVAVVNAPLDLQNSTGMSACGGHFVVGVRRPLTANLPRSVLTLPCRSAVE